MGTEGGGRSLRLFSIVSFTENSSIVSEFSKFILILFFKKKSSLGAERGGVEGNLNSQSMAVNHYSLSVSFPILLLAFKKWSFL